MNPIDINKTYTPTKQKKLTEKQIFDFKKPLVRDSLRNWLKTPKQKKIPTNTLKSLMKKKVGTKTKYGTLTARRKKQISLALTFRNLK